MKAFPVYEALKNDFNLTLIHTGQHFDEKMSKVFFEQLKFPYPDIHLTLNKRTKAGDFDDKLYQNNLEYLKNKDKVIEDLINYKGELGQMGEIRDKLKNEFEKLNLDLVIVFGDVTSTLAAGLASKMLNIDIAHVESGLRSGDSKMPEEVNRILTDHITKYYFVTEQSGVDNLKENGINENVYLVGNTMIDTQKKYLQQALDTKYNEKLDVKSKEYILITLHRPSNVDNMNKLKEIFDDLGELSKNNMLVYPIHPRTKKNLKKIGYLEKVENNKNIILLDPLGYLEFTCLMANCKYVVTDSGGLQEETTALNIPCFTLRENTERPSTLIENNGTNQMIHKISQIKLKECKGNMDLWDGKSSKRILDTINKYKNKYRITFYFRNKFTNYDLIKLINLLKINVYLNVFNFIGDIIKADCKNILDNTDCLVINSEAMTILPYIFENYPNFLKTKKIIIIRTILSYDICHLHIEKNITDSLLIKNIYSTVNPLIMENKKIFNYGNKKNLEFFKKLNYYNNLKLMPLWLTNIKPTIEKKDFYEKYKLDISKKIFTIYLTWPKYYFRSISLSEKYFLKNNILIQKVINILSKLNYNVVFKPHPFFGMWFKPNFISKKWTHSLDKKSHIKMKEMKKIVPQYIFIEMCDSRNIDYFTDIGMIFNCSTFGIHNYLFNIPLLYISENKNIFEKSWNPIGKKFTHELFYGNINFYDNLLNNTNKLLNTFIKKYSNKPKFKYQTNNPLYGNTSTDNDIQLFANYIKTIINK